MKIREILCLLGWVSVSAHASSMDASDRSENPGERSGGISLSHFKEEIDKEDPLKDNKPDVASFAKETNESLLSSKEEEREKPEPYMVIVTDKLSSTGGGVPLLDPNVVNEMILPPFAKDETPWWERWWDDVTEWLFDKGS